MYVDVALPIPLPKALTYLAPAGSVVEPGMRVAAPLGRRVLTGVVVNISTTPPVTASRCKTLVKILDEEPALPASLLALGAWMAEYYFCSLGEALGAMLPTQAPLTRVERWSLREPAPGEKLPRGLAQELLLRLQAGPCARAELLRGLPAGAAQALRVLAAKGFAVVEKKEERANPLPLPQGKAELPLVMNLEQAGAFAAIQTAIHLGKFAPFLLHGVTGSGKTEVYLRAAAETLQQGRSVIFLVPEIALTPQMRARISARFGGQVEVLHSGLSPKERFAAWQRLRNGQTRLALGARSAIFAPVAGLGLIVVDEEYESSYKQEETPRYHARDVAAMRAKQENAVLILGSATPSVESYANARNGKYVLLELPHRADHKQLPEVKLLDMSREPGQGSGLPLFSGELLRALEQRLQAGEQSILFLNRRGYAPLVMCPACKHVLTCPDCSVSLVYHQPQNKLLCHTCGKSLAPGRACPRCGTACIRLAGAGTQRVEAELKKIFPQARIQRIDQDMARKRGALELAMRQFGAGEQDILVGTQMVAKGIDFPNVTLVGIISADTALHLPDFRAEERTFQLLVQVAGRAGRGLKSGWVLAQTLNLGHPVLRLAQQQDFAGFFKREIGQREALLYPPFSRLALVLLQSKDQTSAWKWAEAAAMVMRKSQGEKDAVLGPAASPHERVAQETRVQILVKSLTLSGRMKILRSLQNLNFPAKVRVQVDIDPQHML